MIPDKKKAFIQKIFSNFKTKILRRFQKKFHWYDVMHVSRLIFTFLTADLVILLLLTHINAIFDWIRKFTILKLTAIKRYKFVDMF